MLVSSPKHLECKEILHIAFMLEKLSKQHRTDTNTQPLTSTVIVDLMISLSASALNTLHNSEHVTKKKPGCALFNKKISFEVCPIPEWSEKRNPTEDNLPKNNSCASFRLKKNIYLVGQLGRKGLTTEN